MISKDDFVEVINGIQKNWSFNNELNDLINANGGDGYVFFPDCTDVCLKLLHKIFKDSDKDDWISYFCFDLDFGKEWKEGSITDENGNSIKLQTPEDLYDFLISLVVAGKG